SVDTSACTSSFWLVTETYSPVPMENAPATSAATPVRITVCAETPPPPSPAISEALVTSPSTAASRRTRHDGGATSPPPAPPAGPHDQVHAVPRPLDGLSPSGHPVRRGATAAARGGRVSARAVQPRWLSHAARPAITIVGR